MFKSLVDLMKITYTVIPKLYIHGTHLLILVTAPFLLILMPPELILLQKNPAIWSANEIVMLCISEFLNDK